MSLPSPTMSMSTPAKPPCQSFEFTKRKRWTETLFSEISETLILVVSPTCKVLYCGSAIVELLGWKEDQLVDADLGVFIEDEDQENFRWSFTESLRSGQDLFMYARFKCDQPLSLDPKAKSGVLFELKGHPHRAVGQQQPQCFFLTAMPYPSRDIALLNTFLDLKIENERLSQRIHDLKNCVETSPLASEPSCPSQFSMVQYPQRYNQPPGLLVPNHSSPYSRTAPGPPFLNSSDTPGLGSRMAQKASSSRFDDLMSPINSHSLSGDDDIEDQRRKKLKKALVSEEQRVCVTCGRTDSPEWRKGPHGPKTLCNACGLRWAKRTRKTESDTCVKDPKCQEECETGPERASVTLVNGQQLMFGV